MVEHKPLVPLPGIPRGALPVKISGVNVSGLGISWLQTLVAGNEIQFVPVLKDKEFVHCEVILPQVTKDVSKSCGKFYINRHCKFTLLLLTYYISVTSVSSRL